MEFFLGTNGTLVNRNVLLVLQFSLKKFKFWEVSQCSILSKTVLPDRLVLKEKKLVENAKIKKNSIATF